MPLVTSKNTPIPKTQETLEKRGWKECKSHNNEKFAMRLCFLLISENTFIKSHQYDCPDMFGTRMTPINCHVGLGKVHRNSTLHKLLQAIKESCE